MLENRVVQFACGILYSHSFKLLDNWGAIADSILYNNKFFSAKYFPKISTQYTTSRSLSNDACGHSLQLTPNNLIYTHVVQDDFTSELSEFVRRISEFLIPKIIEENSLIVRRIGIVFTCEISDQGIQSFAEKYFKPEFKEVTDFRFSKKESTVSGAIWSNKSDFINKIYTVGAIGENLSGISFDYQAHYVPPRTYVSDVIKPVLERGKQLLFEEVLTAGEKNGKK